MLANSRFVIIGGLKLIPREEIVSAIRLFRAASGVSKSVSFAGFATIQPAHRVAAHDVSIVRTGRGVRTRTVGQAAATASSFAPGAHADR
ncbi:hypothetical protein [Caballeronia arvi]|uniref:hypothetical protein n=1 Tax=Caballeronia arvi TaxID=1777135 RepID=UPI00117FA465|nr:hypothetical protein [Caballeronia arvi]